MKSKPVRIVQGEGYVGCPVDEATHLTVNIPGPTGRLTVPVIRHGTREGTGCWSWNGDIEFPTLRPSLLTTGHDFRCHIWLNDGKAQFLDDCSHEHRGKTLDLLDVD